MATNEVQTNLDARKLMQESGNKYSVRVKARGLWKLELGLLFVRLGAWIGGLGFEVSVEE